MTKTRAAVLYGHNRPLAVEELSIPALNPGQVLVEIAYSGVCRSQLNEVHGLKGKDNYLPHTLGHEGSGTVEAVGSGVKKVRPGDRVVLTWIKDNGADISSSVYKKGDGSSVNSGAISTFLTKAVISENRLVKIPNEMPLKEAALFGCAIPTGMGIVMNTAKVSPGSSIAIFGLGGIGLSALLAAKIAGAKTIIAIDLLDHKLKEAVELGASHVINSKKEEVLSKILDITGGRGVDYAIEAAGKKDSMEKAFQAARDKGGLCVIAGNLPNGERISIDPFDLIKGKQIVGTWGGETNPGRDIPGYISLYMSGRFNVNFFLTKEYGLENINNALDDLENGKVNRPSIVMGV